MTSVREMVQRGVARLVEPGVYAMLTMGRTVDNSAYVTLWSHIRGSTVFELFLLIRGGLRHDNC